MEGIQMKRIYLDQTDPKVIKEENGQILVTNGVFWIWINKENMPKVKLSTLLMENNAVEKSTRDYLEKLDDKNLIELKPKILDRHIFSLTNPAFLDSKAILENKQEDKTVLVSSKYLMVANFCYPPVAYFCAGKQSGQGATVHLICNDKTVGYIQGGVPDENLLGVIKNIGLAERIAQIKGEDKE